MCACACACAYLADTSQRHRVGTGEPAREAGTDSAHSESLWFLDSCISGFRVGWEPALK